MQTLVERMGELRLGIQTPPAQTPVTPEQVPEGKGAVEPKQVAPVPAPPPSSEWGVWVRGFGSGMRINNDVSRVLTKTSVGSRLEPTSALDRCGAVMSTWEYLAVICTLRVISGTEATVLPMH
jgi:hypothetical protein